MQLHKQRIMQLHKQSKDLPFMNHHLPIHNVSWITAPGNCNSSRNSEFWQELWKFLVLTFRRQDITIMSAKPMNGKLQDFDPLTSSTTSKGFDRAAFMNGYGDKGFTMKPLVDLSEQKSQTSSQVCEVYSSWFLCGIALYVLIFLDSAGKNWNLIREFFYLYYNFENLCNK